MNRSYRDRKDKYIKSLEKEVQRAVHRETELVREVESLRESVGQLTELLSQYGIPSPSQPPGDTGYEAGRATDEPLGKAAVPKGHPVRSRKLKGSTAVISSGDDTDHETIDVTSHPALLGSTRTHTYPEDRMEVLMNQPPLLGTSKKAVGVQWDSGRLQNSDLVGVAMEFVLTYVSFFFSSTG